jgi:hypothetical protein
VWGVERNESRTDAGGQSHRRAEVTEFIAALSHSFFCATHSRAISADKDLGKPNRTI